MEIRAGSSPEPRNGVSVENRIGADDRDVLAHGLGDQQAIERAAVMERKTLDGRCVFKGDGERIERGLVQCVYEISSTRLAKRQLAEPRLDGDLSAARDAHQFLVRRVFHQRLGRPAERWIVLAKPEEGVSVNEQDHSIYSLKSSSGSSKSGDIQNSALR